LPHGSTAGAGASLNATQLGSIRFGGFSRVNPVGHPAIGGKQGVKSPRGVDDTTFVRDFDGEICPAVDYQAITVHRAQGALLRDKAITK
jgi:hypothetical protein